MSQRLFSVSKVGLFLDSYKGATEKRKQGEVKVVVMQLRVQPFDAKLAATIDDGVGDESNVRATLFKLNHPDPKAHLDRVNFALGCPRQILSIFASPDTEEARLAFDQVKISGTYARTEKGVNGYAFVFTATYGPAGRDELEFIQHWLHTQHFVTFDESEPLLGFEEDGEDETDEATDADEKARRPAPMWEDPSDAPAPAAKPKAKAKTHKNVNRKLHSHQGGKKKARR
jgi:hypothetical protein